MPNTRAPISWGERFAKTYSVYQVTVDEIAETARLRTLRLGRPVTEAEVIRDTAHRAFLAERRRSS
jgi:reverse gyrase